MFIVLCDCCCSFVIVDLPFGGADGQYLVNLTMSVCFEAGQPCDTVITVFRDSVLPKQRCNRRRDFLDSGLYNQPHQILHNEILIFNEKYVYLFRGYLFIIMIIIKVYCMGKLSKEYCFRLEHEYT